MASKYSKQIVDNVEPTRVPTSHDIAWVAGFYEGEGHASGIKGRTIAHLTQKDPETLYRIREYFGGSITQVRINTPHYCHQWKLYGDKARLFFQAIYPYMSVRRKLQIEKANGLRFTGKAQPNQEPMSEERKQLRANMTSQEKVNESYRAHRAKHYEKVTAYQREHVRRKRLGLPTKVLAQNLPVSELVH